MEQEFERKMTKKGTEMLRLDWKRPVQLRPERSKDISLFTELATTTDSQLHPTLIPSRSHRSPDSQSGILGLGEDDEEVDPASMTRQEQTIWEQPELCPLEFWSRDHSHIKSRRLEISLKSPMVVT